MFLGAEGLGGGASRSVVDSPRTTTAAAEHAENCRNSRKRPKQFPRPSVNSACSAAAFSTMIAPTISTHRHRCTAVRTPKLSVVLQRPPRRSRVRSRPRSPARLRSTATHPRSKKRTGPSLLESRRVKDGCPHGRACVEAIRNPSATRSDPLDVGAVPMLFRPWRNSGKYCPAQPQRASIPEIPR